MPSVCRDCGDVFESLREAAKHELREDHSTVWGSTVSPAGAAIDGP